jgi:hypothetical protein
MSAVVHEILGSFHRLPDLKQLSVRLVRLAEVGTKPALSIMYVQHWFILLQEGRQTTIIRVAANRSQGQLRPVR